MIIVGHAHAFQTSKEAGSNAEQVSELYANKIIYYPNEERTIAVGNVHATVYPGSGGMKSKDKDKDKDKKKKKKKTSDAAADDAAEVAADNKLDEDATKWFRQACHPAIIRNLRLKTAL